MPALEPKTAIAIKDRPIIFSGPMVRAILEDRKTQTRRVAALADNVRVCDGVAKGFLPGAPDGFVIPCPYGKPGDRLWVRETFALQCNVEDDAPPFSDGRPIKCFDNEDESGWLQPHYKATDPQPELTCPESPRHNCGSEDICASPWQPSIHMPRWASRLTLEITKVRVERVQEISHKDALAEGCQGCDWVESTPYIAGPHTDAGELPVEEYQKLWDCINSKRGFGWDKNPWVWVIEFKRIEAAQ